MKSWMLFATTLAATVMAAALPDAIQKSSIAGYGHWATFTDSTSGYTFDLHAQDHVGAPIAIMINSSEYAPRHQFRSLQPDTLQSVEDRDICDKLELCYNIGCDSAVTGAIWIANTAGSVCSAIGGAIYTYFTYNDYANLNQVIIGTVVGLYVNAALTPIGDAILNSLHKLVNTSSTTDACGVTQREVLANDFGNAIYQFCSSIQAAKSTTTFTNFVAGDVLSTGSTQDAGEISMTKAFVAAQAGNWGPTCAALGVTWKRWLGLDPFA